MYEMRYDSDFRLSETDLIEKEPFYLYMLDKLKELRKKSVNWLHPFRRF